MVQINRETRIFVLATRHKYHRTKHKKLLDDYDDFNNYVIVGSLRATTNFGGLDVPPHVMTLEASRVVSRLSHNNNNTAVLSNIFVPYLRESYEQLLSQIK